MTLTVTEASKKLGLPTQTLRLSLQQGLYPFGKAIVTTKPEDSKNGKGRYTYWISEELLDKFLRGELK